MIGDGFEGDEVVVEEVHTYKGLVGIDVGGVGRSKDGERRRVGKGGVIRGEVEGVGNVTVAGIGKDSGGFG